MRERGYDADLVLWAEYQAHALREAARIASNWPIDWENVAEEIEDLARSDRRELANRIGTILLHLIKLEASPAEDPRRSWRETIITQRRGLKRLLRESPSLNEEVTDRIAEELPGAKEDAAATLNAFGETSRCEVASLSYTPDQVTGDWFPDN